MNDTVNQPPVRVRMDRSRDFALVSGDRNRSDDPHRHTHFYQDGLPFDAQGYLIFDHVELQGDSPEAKKLQALVEKKAKKASKNQIKEPVDGADQPADGNDADDDDDEEGDGQVNLEDWITGRDNYPWQDVSNAILARYSKRVTSQAEGVAFLVDEKLVPAEQVAKRYRKYL
jgi:hypothetical protein